MTVACVDIVLPIMLTRQLIPVRQNILSPSVANKKQENKDSGQGYFLSRLLVSEIQTLDTLP